MSKLSNEEIEILARYNSECARGLLHSESWHRQMSGLQARFYQEYYTGPGLSPVIEDGWDKLQTG
jgi:hypothetical protein